MPTMQCFRCRRWDGGCDNGRRDRCALAVTVIFMCCVQRVWTAPAADADPASGASSSSSGASGVPSWSYAISHSSRQGVSSLQASLASVEERLRGVDAALSLRVAPRLELGLEQLGRRLEALEARMSRGDALLEVRLLKINEALSSKQMKEDLANEQLGRKIENVYERISHRTSYMDARLDLVMAKYEAKVEAKLAELQKTVDSNHDQTRKIQERVEQVQKAMHGFTSQMGNLQNNAASCSEIPGILDDNIGGIMEHHVRNLRHVINAKADLLADKMEDSSDRLKELELELEDTKGELRRNELQDQSALVTLQTSLNNLQMVIQGNMTADHHSPSPRPLSDLFHAVDQQDQSIVALQDAMSSSVQRLTQMELSIQELINHTKTEQDSMHDHQHELNSEEVRHSGEEVMTDMQLDVRNLVAQASTGFWKNISNAVLDGLTSSETGIKESIGTEAKNIAYKLSNMYNDLWDALKKTQKNVEDLMSMSNVTRREMQEGFRPRAQTLKRSNCPSGDLMEQTLDGLGALLKRKLSEINEKVDSNFQMLLMAQNMFMDSCHRIQMNEPQLELKISHVLDKMLSIFLNRSSSTSREVHHMREFFTSHALMTNLTLSRIGQDLAYMADRLAGEFSVAHDVISLLKSELLGIDSSNRRVSHIVHSTGEGSGFDLEDQINAAGENLVPDASPSNQHVKPRGKEKRVGEASTTSGPRTTHAEDYYYPDLAALLGKAAERHHKEGHKRKEDYEYYDYLEEEESATEKNVTTPVPEK